MTFMTYLDIFAAKYTHTLFYLYLLTYAHPMLFFSLKDIERCEGTVLILEFNYIQKLLNHILTILLQLRDRIRHVHVIVIFRKE